jgi:two-component system sensor histidine kinase KdpD
MVFPVALAGVAAVLAERLRRHALIAERQANVERLRNAILSALSHDLRAPLTVLVGVTSALSEGRYEPHRQREFNRMAAAEAARLRTLVEALLELTRLEHARAPAQGGFYPVDEVVGSALRRLERQTAGRSVRTRVPEDIPMVAVDPVLIEQVLVNLVENVLRHAGERSSVEVRAWLEREQVHVEVADRGVGVPEGDEERVFDKLHRARPGSGGGSGLGLTICRAIVSAHGGRIWLKNRVGGGTSVTFTLPTAPDYGVVAAELPLGLDAADVSSAAQ